MTSSELRTKKMAEKLIQKRFKQEIKKENEYL